MPRERNKARRSKDETGQEQATTTTSTTKERNTMANVLDASTIQELLAKQKSRGDYDTELSEFLKSGVAGIEVSLSEGRFQGKAASNVKTGLDNARKRTNDAGNLVHDGAQNVKVISLSEGEGDSAVEHVYLINTAVSADDE